MTEDLDDATRAHLDAAWDRLRAMHRRLAVDFRPHPGSRAAADDEALHPEGPSHVARLSLAIGTDCLATVVETMRDHGPRLFAYAPQLRTALVGGAQAIWLLAPDEREKRLDRAECLSREAWHNRRMWLDDWRSWPGDGNDVSTLDGDHLVASRRLEELGARPRLNATDMIDEAVRIAFGGRPDLAAIRIEAKTAWRETSCVAHALPWELTARHQQHAVRTGGGLRTTAVRATLVEHEGTVSVALTLIEAGWRLLDEHAAPMTS